MLYLEINGTIFQDYSHILGSGIVWLFISTKKFIDLEINCTEIPDAKVTMAS